MSKKDMNDAGPGTLEQLLAATDAAGPMAARDRDGRVTDLALRQLDKVVEEIGGVQDLKAAMASLQPLFEERWLVALGAASRCRPGAVRERLFKLQAGPRGIGKHVDSLDKAIQREADRETVDGHPLAALVRTLDPALAKLKTPRGYRVDLGGVWGNEEQIAPFPLVIRGRSMDASTGQRRLRLAWREGEKWTSHEIGRAQALDARAITPALAGFGAPVDGARARGVVVYLAQFEALNAEHLPVQRVTTRTGWLGDTYVAGPGGPVDLEDSTGDFRRWCPSGSWEGWVEVLDVLPSEPVAALCLAFAGTGPLLRFLELEHQPVLDLAGRHGRGKTTSARVAASMYGLPFEDDGGVVRTWDATPTALERTAARSWDTLLVLDETRRFRFQDDLGNMLYTLAQGRGKARGTVAGTQGTATWRVPILSTGESAVVDRTEAGGARARALTVHAVPAIRGGYEVAASLAEGLRRHHGHLAPRVAALTLERRNVLRDQHRAALLRLSGANPAADHRMMSTAAAIEVSGELLLELGVPLGSGWREVLNEAVTRSGAADDPAGRALDVVREELASHAHQYQGNEPASGTTTGTVYREQTSYRGIWRVARDECVGVYPGTLRDVLAKRGFVDIATIVATWAERGVLRSNHGFQLKTDVKGQRNVLVYAFRLASL